MLNDIRHRKNSVVGIVIASVCILVYLGALVSVIVRIYNGMERRAIAAEREFYSLADLASSSAVLGFMDDTYMAAIQDFLDSSKTLEGVIISGPNGEYAFEKERGKAISQVNGSPRFRRRIDLSAQPLYQPLRIQGLRNVNIQAVAGALDYAELGDVLKQALILVASALALAVAAYVASWMTKNRNAAVSGAEGKKPASSRETDSGGADSSEGEAAYSRRGNIIREDYTGNRITAELHQSAATAQDMSLIFVEFKPATDETFYARFAADAARFFSSKEFVCERGERGIAVICPGLNIDTAFLNADEFHNRILGKYPGLFKAKTDLCMGISARSGRPVNATQLMFEAEEALERAMMDPASHIVAFKSDPEKYRTFMENRSREQD